MTSLKLKKLLETAAAIINIYLEEKAADASWFRIAPFYDEYDKGSEVVTIEFDVYEFNFEFLEPLASRLSDTPIKWSIGKDDGKFNLNLFY